jgi:hypothetical protein
MSCPFYGKHAYLLDPPGMVDQHGNQCAIIVHSYSPCVMEVSLGMKPDAQQCLLLESAGLLRAVYEAKARRGQALIELKHQVKEPGT